MAETLSTELETLLRQERMIREFVLSLDGSDSFTREIRDLAEGHRVEQLKSIRDNIEKQAQPVVKGPCK